VTDVHTSRLLLHAIDVGEAERIMSGIAGPSDVWAHDFPFEGDRIAVGAFLRRTTESGEQLPFGHYQIADSSNGLAIGGIGFKSRPTIGCVEIGYGLVPSARGHGYAAEALTALLDLAATHGVLAVIAATTPDNAASQRTLERVGFEVVRTDERLRHYEALLVQRSPE